MYSSPGNLALFLFADALGQPERLVEQDTEDKKEENKLTIDNS